MANYNKTILVGNATRDPAFKQINGGTTVADFGLAVNHKYRTKSGEDKEEVLFIDCTIFGKGAEIINQYVRKGKPLLVEGRLRYETWESKDGGGKRSKISLVVDNFQFLGGRDDAGGDHGGDSDGGQRRQQAPPARPPAPSRAPSGGGSRQNAGADFGDPDGESFNPDDVPFRVLPNPLRFPL